MSIAHWHPPYEIPSYSLTGDVLSFRVCGLQYRYYNRSSLPPSRPVQMWTGEFLHGVLEDAYHHWGLSKPAFPWPHPHSIDELPRLNKGLPQDWPKHHVGRLGARMEKHLAAAGRSPRNKHARFNAYRRAAEAINRLGPNLFPLITNAEEAVSGTRQITLPANTPRNADRYELKGVVDVISSVRLLEHKGNPLVELFRPGIPAGEEVFDVIVDYKGMRRPSFGPDTGLAWNDHAWQIQTYAWLRNKRQDRARVGCGLIIYLNELFPSRQDMVALRDDHAHKSSDVLAERGSADHYALMGVKPGANDDQEDLPGTPALSLAFRLRRAVRIISVDQASQDEAVDRIEGVVEDIEQRVADEHADGEIRAHWPTTGRQRDCVACDFSHSCPGPAWVRQGAPNPAPVAPG